MRSRHTKRDFVFASLKVGPLRFAIDINNVREVAKYTSLFEIHGSPSFIDGFVKWRGLAVPVIDLRKRFRVPFREGGKIVITQLEGHLAGLAVDEVCDVAAGSREMMIRPGSSQEPWSYCVEAVLDAGGSPVHILNLKELLEEKEKEALKVFSGAGGSTL